MFLSVLTVKVWLGGFLHACGDVSPSEVDIATIMLFSPRMWRCFFSCWTDADFRGVFFTYVEMFLNTAFLTWAEACFLHIVEMFRLYHLPGKLYLFHTRVDIVLYS